MKYPELLSEFRKLQTDVANLSSSGVSPSSPDSDKRFELLAESISKINEEIKQLKDRPVESVKTDSISSPLSIKHSSYKPKGYVPQAYRQICDEVLSPEFGFDCIENTHNLDFEIQIIVPHEYSSLTEQEKLAGVQDIRSRVISRALGENGVREWCIKVRNNLNQFFTRAGVKSPFNSQSIVV